MAWFTCMAGVGGKGNSVIVTCDADFAGVPITCTNGQKTYTKVCPSFSPYEVTFTGLVAGTWTISATVDGVVYSTTAIVTDITAVLSYGFNWKMWVDSSSSLHSSDYTDLADLLSDEAAIRQLFTEHAPTDYAASTATVTPDLATVLNNDLCAKWINLRDYALDTLYANPLIAAAMDSADKYFYGEWGIVDDTTTPPTWGAKGNVPVMTSLTAPYGTVSVSSTSSEANSYGYNAFDGSYATAWRSNTGAGSWIQYKFVNPVCVREVGLAYSASQANAGDWTLSGSNDGLSFTPIQTGIKNSTDNTELKTKITNSTYYLYYRLTATQANFSTTAVQIKLIQFYGRELSVSVPTMTSNTTPYGEASGSSAATNAPIYHAFDENTNTAWGSTTTLGWIQYQFINKIVPKMVGIGTLSSGSNRQALKGTVQAIVNGTSIDLKEFSVIETAGQIAYIDIENDQDIEYDTLRLNITQSNVVNGNVTVNTFQIYGLDYSEKEFEEGTTKKWLYDHGVELEELTFSGITRSGSTFEAPTKESDYIKILASANNIHSAFKNSVAIDFTDYNLVRASGANRDFSNTPTDNQLKPYILVNTDGTYNDSSRIAFVSNPMTNPYNIGFDISSVNQSGYIVAGTLNTRGTSINEIWLE